MFMKYNIFLYQNSSVEFKCIFIHEFDRYLHFTKPVRFQVYMFVFTGFKLYHERMLESEPQPLYPETNKLIIH